MPRSALFLVFINYLVENIGSMLSKFADNTNVGDVVNSTEDCLRPQQDIDQVKSGVEHLQMEFDPNRHEVIHFQKSSTCRPHAVNDRAPRNDDEQRNLGIRSSVEVTGSRTRHLACLASEVKAQNIIFVMLCCEFTKH